MVSGGPDGRQPAESPGEQFAVARPEGLPESGALPTTCERPPGSPARLAIAPPQPLPPASLGRGAGACVHGVVSPRSTVTAPPVCGRVGRGADGAAGGGTSRGIGVPVS